MWHISDAPNFENSLQTRRGTDWQSEHRKQVQQHDLEQGTVCPYDETQAQHWPKRQQNIPVRFANIAKSAVFQSESGLAESASTHLLAALGNHSHEHLTLTVVFYDVQWKAQRLPIWHSSHNRPPLITSVLLLLAKYLKKSEYTPRSA